MAAHHSKHSVFAIAPLLLLALAGTTARAQDIYELRCRGRGGAFAIERVEADSHSLRFTAGARGAGVDSGGLDPGTCAWIDRAVNSAEPLLIHFTAGPPQVTSISQRLNDPDGYWSFFVFNTNQGYFEAKSHNAWTAAPTTAADVTARTTNADLTSRGGQPTNADITPRRSVLDPSGKPEIDRQTYKDEDLRVPVITDISAIPAGESVTISFTTFPNVVPLVDLARTPPVRANRRWSFPSGSAVVTRPAGGDPAHGKYTVEMSQELDPGLTYYFIIHAKADNGPSAELRQEMRQFRMPGAPQATSYVVRYRGFYCQETTTGPASDEIYVIVSISFVDPSGNPATFTGRHPEQIKEDVGNDEHWADPGRMVYQGEPVNLLLTVTVMEHDSGNPDEYRNEAQDAATVAFATLVTMHPQLIVPLLVAPEEVVGAIYDVGSAVSEALGTGDDVIGTASRLITAGEMKDMGSEEGTFFTEHHGHGGIYRVHFDIVPR